MPMYGQPGTQKSTGEVDTCSSQHTRATSSPTWFGSGSGSGSGFGLGFGLGFRLAFGFGFGFALGLGPGFRSA